MSENEPETAKAQVNEVSSPNRDQHELDAIDTNASNETNAGPCASATSASNETITAMLHHRSIRSYTDEPVDDAALDQIIAAAQAAPNWVNLQHVSIIVVKDPERRKRFAELCGGQEHVAEAPVFLVFCGDFFRTELALEMQHQELGNIAEDLDNLIMVSHEAGIALEAATVAAESLGLGTVAIGAVRLRAKEAIRELDLPEHVIPLLGLCIGHPADDPGLKPRLPREAMCFDEHYNRNLVDLLVSYDETYADYLAKRNSNSRVGNWSQLVAHFYQPTRAHYPETPSMLRQQGFFDANER